MDWNESTKKPLDGYNTLYLDFDGTIVNTVKAIVSLYNDDFRYYKGFKKINWEEITTWEFKECKLAAAKYIDKYFNQPRFFASLEFMPWAETTINELGKYYDLKIISMGNQPNLVGKEHWLNNHFPEIEFTGIDFKNSKDKSKVDMSDGILIDDSYDNLKSSNAAMKICFGNEYDWNKKWDGLRAGTWMDIKELLIV